MFIKYRDIDMGSRKRDGLRGLSPRMPQISDVGGKEWESNPPETSNASHRI